MHCVYCKACGEIFYKYFIDKVELLYSCESDLRYMSFFVNQLKRCWSLFKDPLWLTEHSSWGFIVREECQLALGLLTRTYRSGDSLLRQHSLISVKLGQWNWSEIRFRAPFSFQAPCWFVVTSLLTSCRRTLSFTPPLRLPFYALWLADNSVFSETRLARCLLAKTFVKSTLVYPMILEEAGLQSEVRKITA